MNEKYALYEQSWNIAQNQMKDPVRTRNLKNEFIQQFPESNLAFALRVNLIEEMRKDPAQRGNAAAAYIDLHNDVRAGRVDSGDINPEEIYLWPEIHSSDKNQDKVVETPYLLHKPTPNTKKPQASSPSSLISLARRISSV